MSSEWGPTELDRNGVANQLISKSRVAVDTLHELPFCRIKVPQLLLRAHNARGNITEIYQ